LRSEFSWQANNEILHGRWDGIYNDTADARPPGFWRNSIDIIGKWYDSNSRVRYGQVRSLKACVGTSPRG
jgi:hypothetical protein